MKHLIALMFIPLILISCSSSNSYMNNPLAPGGSGRHIKVDGISREQGDKLKSSNAKDFQRIMVYNAYLTLETTLPFDTLTDAISEITKEMGGYVMSFNNYGINIRIPTEKLKSTINVLDNFGEIVQKDIQSSDISEQYYDAKLRLDNAEKTLKRYLELLDKAEDVQTILNIEKEIERVNELVERYKGQLARMDHIHEFSTIYIKYSEKQYPGPVTFVLYGVWSAVKLLFVW